MLKDNFGNTLTTTSESARDAYVKGVDLYLAANAGVEQAFSEAIAADEKFALAHLALARHWQTIGQGRQARITLEPVAALSNGLTTRESSHINAVGLLLEGKSAESYLAVRSHLLDYPRDVMVAQTCMGVFSLIGFSGKPGREAEHLAFTTSLAPDYGDNWWFLTQHAFAQMECGQLAPAEKTIEIALAANPHNANGAHYRAHLYYENGEREAGYEYLTDWLKDYDRQGLLHCHLHWHVALWALARGDIETMWQVVDTHVAPSGAWGPALNVLTDMAALLYRAGLAGVEISTERWQTISDYALQTFPKPRLAFADVHAALAHAMAGNQEALSRIVSDANGPAGDIVKILAESFAAIVSEDWAGATVGLLKVMSDHERIGGSRAQRDLIEYALAQTLLKQGQTEEAKRLLVMRRPLATDFSALSGV
jgi:tetratricopeptide (TPR) repeat protein